MKATQGTGQDGRPLCWNREGAGNFLMQDGWLPGFTADGTPTRYPIMVEVPNRFSRECHSWTSDPSTDPVPLAEGWKCSGCRHFPVDKFSQALLNLEARKTVDKR